MPKNTQDPFDVLRKAGTNGANYDLDTEDIIARLIAWQSRCEFQVTGAEGDTLDLVFTSLPKDLDAFVAELYDFCPDLVDQGTGCVVEMIESMEEAEQEIPEELKKLIEGVDLEDPNYGIELLKRELVAKMQIQFWWD